MRTTLVTASVLAGLALAGCDKTIDDLPDPSDAQLTRLSSCDALRDYAGDVMLETVLDSKYGYWGRWGTDDLDSGAVEGGGSDGPTDFTTTNVQEEGVDELDIVKTDGKFIYAAQDRAVHIVKSWPVGESEKLATIELDGWAQGLFLKDEEGKDRLQLIHDQEQSALFIKDKKGTVRIGVAQFSHGGGGFALHGPDSKGAAVLYFKKSGSLRIFDDEGAVTDQLPAPRPRDQ